MDKKAKSAKKHADVKAEEVKAEEVKEPEEKAEETETVQDDPIEAMNAEIAALQSQLSESKNSLLRAYADTDNLKKRLQKEADTVKKYRFQSAATELLPILDNLDRALAHVPDNPEVQNFVKGFEMIRTQLVSVLENEGVKEIDALNQPFDANWMQALMTEKKEGEKPGMVLEVLQKGYKLKDRMIRPALVKVSE